MKAFGGAVVLHQCTCLHATAIVQGSGLQLQRMNGKHAPFRRARARLFTHQDVAFTQALLTRLPPQTSLSWCGRSCSRTATSGPAGPMGTMMRGRRGRTTAPSTTADQQASTVVAELLA